MLLAYIGSFSLFEDASVVNFEEEELIDDPQCSIFFSSWFYYVNKFTLACKCLI